MGKLKNALSSATSRIAAYLLQNGFRYESYVCGSNYGYQKSFPVEDGLYRTYIHCDLNRGVLNIYKEYDCGGEVSSYSCDIPESLIQEDDPESFMDWLDEETECYL